MSTEAVAAPRSWQAGSGRAVLSFARDYGIVVALVALAAFFAIATDTFLTQRNLTNLAEQSAEPALLACGMTVVIIAGEFDLSVGAILGFAAVVAAFVANEAAPLAAVVAAVAAGAGLGVINGTIVSRLRVQSFLATLATQFVIVGAAIYLTAGTDSYRVNDFLGFSQFADNKLLGIQYKAWIALGAFFLVWGLLRGTRFGKQVYAVGGNAAAARISGVRIPLITTSVFVVSGALAAVAGAIAASDTGVAQADGGVGMEFTAIAAVVIGGTSVAGGRGGVWRTLAGVLLLAVVANGFTLLYISPTWDQLVQGAIILTAILLDAWLKRKAAT
ncbi:MAG: ABC transporter permease [Solirubrobacterales bacterium]